MYFKEKFIVFFGTSRYVITSRYCSYKFELSGNRILHITKRER